MAIVLSFREGFVPKYDKLLCKAYLSFDPATTIAASIW